MKTSPRTIVLGLAAGAAAALVLAGCGSSSPGGSGAPGYAPGLASSPTPSRAATSSAATSSAAAGTRVTATEKEFTIVLSTTAFKPGRYTFEVRNQGTMPHNLTITGPGVDKQASPTLPAGGTGQVTVNLQKGSYDLFCSVDAHKDQGMDLTIQVS